MTVAADPDRRPFRQGAALLRFQPLVELNCAAAYIGVGRAGHFQGLPQLQDRNAMRRPQRFYGGHGLSDHRPALHLAGIRASDRRRKARLWARASQASAVSISASRLAPGASPSALRRTRPASLSQSTSEKSIPSSRRIVRALVMHEDGKQQNDRQRNPDQPK